MWLKFFVYGIFSASLGAELVHLYYNPMKNFPALVEEDICKIRAKIAEIKLKQSNVL